MNKEEKELHYYYAAITYKRKSDPEGMTRCSFTGASYSFSVTQCIKSLEEIAEDIKPGSAVIDNVMEITKDDFEAYNELCKRYKAKED